MQFLAKSGCARALLSYRVKSLSEVRELTDYLISEEVSSAPFRVNGKWVCCSRRSRLKAQTPMPERRHPALPPRLVNRESAAAYTGIGATKFDELVRLGVMPKATRLGTRRLWDVRRLDARNRRPA